jgi:hypothetical protein
MSNFNRGDKVRWIPSGGEIDGFTTTVLDIWTAWNGVHEKDEQFFLSRDKDCRGVYRWPSREFEIVK